MGFAWLLNEMKIRILKKMPTETGKTNNKFISKASLIKGVEIIAAINSKALFRLLEQFKIW